MHSFVLSNSSFAEKLKLVSEFTQDFSTRLAYYKISNENFLSWSTHSTFLVGLFAYKKFRKSRLSHKLWIIFNEFSCLIAKTFFCTQHTEGNRFNTFFEMARKKKIENSVWIPKAFDHNTGLLSTKINELKFTSNW